MPMPLPLLSRTGAYFSITHWPYGHGLLAQLTSALVSKAPKTTGAVSFHLWILSCGSHIKNIRVTDTCLITEYLTVYLL